MRSGLGTLLAGLSRISRGRSAEDGYRARNAHINSATGRGEEGEARPCVVGVESIELTIDSKVDCTQVLPGQL